MQHCAAWGRATSVPLILSLLSACTTLHRHPPDDSRAPYPRSRFVTGVSWDFSNMLEQRKAHGSDLWPCTWAADSNLYCAWGDGGGFDGDDDHVGRVSLGFARVLGTPDKLDPGSFTGRNVWGEAPAYAENQATFGGKVATMISVDGTLYAYGHLWTEQNTSDPVHRGSDGPLQTLIWSTDLGKSWQIAPWTSNLLGSFLNFGQDNAGALDSFVYIYYKRPADSTRVYLARVEKTKVSVEPATPGTYQYLTGVDRGGVARSWSTSEADANAVFFDPNGAYAEVVYDAPIGRFLLTAAHNAGDATATASAGKVGLFEGPHPWGPWATVGYYNSWGDLGPESYGDYLGLGLPTKWISPDGKFLWAVFSSLGQYDSFNLASASLTVAAGAPQIIAPATGTVLAPGTSVTARGTGARLSWSVSRLDDTHFSLARGKGASISFQVPDDGSSGLLIRVTLMGRRGSVYRDYSVSARGNH
jgi:hypothetical protein